MEYRLSLSPEAWTSRGVPAGPLVGEILNDGSRVKVALGARAVPLARNAWMKCWAPKSAGTVILAVNEPVELVWTVPSVLWKVPILMPVTWGVGVVVVPPTTQVALDAAHWRVRPVLAGRPVPVTVMEAPTIAALGETVIPAEAAAALDGAAIRRKQRRPEPAATETKARGLCRDHLVGFMDVVSTALVIRGPGDSQVW